MIKFLGGFYDYPVAQEQAAILPLLRDDFTRAVVFEAPGLAFDGSLIVDDDAFQGLDDFWRDKSTLKGAQAYPGMTEYTPATLTPDAVRAEAAKAGLSIRDDAAAARLCQSMVQAAEIFSDVTRGYLGRDDFYMRIWQMWGPHGALGRMPFLHIDRTYLTGLWYAGRASAEIYTGDVPEDVWKSLSPQRQNDHQNDPVLQDFSESVDPVDIMSVPVGPLLITKNSKAKNLDDPAARNSVCIHRSGDVARLGQAGIIMTPKFMD